MNYFDKKRKYFMSSKKTEEYIKDGLQLWIDGIENTRNGHSSDRLTYLRDLSENNYDFNILNGYAVMPEDNCIPFNGDCVYRCPYSGLQELMLGLKERTIEIVCSISDINTDAKTIFLGGKSGALNSGVGMWYSHTRGGMAISGNSNCFTIKDVTNPHTYCVIYNTTSINSSQFYQDNVVCTKITGGTMASSDVLIGGRNYNGTSAYRFYGKIYCIRVYDRQLTQEEREHNRKVDKERFGI